MNTRFSIRPRSEDSITSRGSPNVCAAPVALLSIVEAHRQFFINGFGRGEPFGSEREAPTSISLCRYVVDYSRPLILSDAPRLPEFCDHVAVREHSSVQAHLGMPLQTHDGYVLGAFCVNDSEPHKRTVEDIAAMETFTGGVMAELENRRQMARLCQTLERGTDQLKSARASRHQLGAILEHPSDAIIALSPDGCVLSWSGAGEILYGYRAAEMIGEWITRVIPAERRARYPDFFEYIRAGNRIPAFESERLRRDGCRVAVEDTPFLSLDAQEQVEAISSLARDITVQVNARRSLQTNGERFRSVFESATDAIINCDSGGRILLWNPGATHLFGYAREAALANARASLVLPLKHQSGADVTAELVLTACDSHGGRHISAIIRDISERMRFEAQLRDAQKMEAVGRMAAGIAHDFNNFNTIIRGFLDLARAELEADSPLHEYLEEARATTDRSVQLTRQIMDLCREARRAPAESINLEDAVREWLPAFQTLLGPAIILHFAAPKDSARVDIDRGDLFRVLTNLLANARDAIEGSGRVELAIEARRGVIPQIDSGLNLERDLVFITVADSGPGIDPEVQARIFEPFFTTKIVEAGTGLGLATVYRILQNAGGNISVVSEPGAGATFTIRLPAARSAPE